MKADGRITNGGRMAPGAAGPATFDFRLPTFAI